MSLFCCCFLAVSLFDVIDDQGLEFLGNARTRSVMAFSPSMNTGAAGFSPVPGREIRYRHACSRPDR